MPEPLPCPGEWTLADLAAGASRPDREMLLTHVSVCPRCLELMSDLLSAPAEASMPAQSRQDVLQAVRRRSPWLPLAAAGLLLAVGGILALRSSPSGMLPLPPPPTPPAPMPPPGEIHLTAGQATAVTLKAGSQAHEVRPGTLRLLAGAAWIENPGEPFELLLPGGRVSVTEGTLLAEILPGPSGFSWLPEARAAEGGRARLVVLSGSALWIPEGGREVPVRAGQEVRLEPSGVQGPFPAGPLPAWRGEGWQWAEGLPVRFDAGTRALVPGGLKEPYVWEAVLRRVAPQASAGVRFETGGACWELPLGAALEQAKGWLRVRVEVREGLARVQAGPYESLRVAVPDLSKRLDKVSGSPGLKAWGGAIEVKELRWRTAS